VSCKPRYVKRILIMRGFRQVSNALDSSSPPARSSPTEWCRPNAALDVSRPVGTRGGVGWMRGPCACPRGDATGWLHRTQTNVMPAGQAPGPHPAPRPPLVPTGRSQTFPLIPRCGWRKSSGRLFKRSRTFPHIEPCLSVQSDHRFLA
jgi:hypothetical protein